MQNTRMPENHSEFVPVRRPEDIHKRPFEGNPNKMQESQFEKPPLYNTNAANDQGSLRYGSFGRAPWGGFEVNEFFLQLLIII